MCQDEGANVPLESDREDEEDSRKVTFSIYSVIISNHFKYPISIMNELQKDHLRELFRCAVARQTEVMVQNILGNGIDIPLLGLREACRETTGQLHELFNDDSYKIANCFLLSTSQVSNTHSVVPRHFNILCTKAQNPTQRGLIHYMKRFAKAIEFIAWFV